jgi:hypothetical protein
MSLPLSEIVESLPAPILFEYITVLNKYVWGTTLPTIQMDGSIGIVASNGQGDVYYDQTVSTSDWQIQNQIGGPIQLGIKTLDNSGVVKPTISHDFFGGIALNYNNHGATNFNFAIDESNFSPDSVPLVQFLHSGGDIYETITNQGAQPLYLKAILDPTHGGGISWEVMYGPHKGETVFTHSTSTLLSTGHGMEVSGPGSVSIELQVVDSSLHKLADMNVHLNGTVDMVALVGQTVEPVHTLLHHA